MPSKGARAAARQRQAKERSRKRKSPVKGRGQEFDAGPSESRTAVVLTDPDLLEGEDAMQPQNASRLATQTAVRPARRSRQRQSNEPLIYRFIGGELRQIGMIAVLMGVILAVLTFVLGG